MKRFRFSWPEGYGVPPPEVQEAGIEFMTEDIGYVEHDRAMVEALAVGEEYRIPGMADLHIIERIA